MIDRIRQFFEQHIIAPDVVSEDELDHQLRLASAALMIEGLHADYSVNQDELDILRDTLQQNFGISQDEALELIQLAKAERTEATDYYQFTSLINEYYTQQQKRDLVTHLWQMAYADRTIHKFEEHLVRRLSDLLHVPHSAFIQSKHKAARKSVKRHE
jgi:uncharacterized tellurite resistance protein B-like protein